MSIPPPETTGRELLSDLQTGVDGEVRFDDQSRGAYSTDASNYRHVPLGVVMPRSRDAAVEAIRICARHGVPLTARGGGTSLAGQATGSGLVLDFSKYCNRLLSVDPDRRRCVVEPGIVLDELNRALAPSGLRFGPEPATHPNCTLGGMIGNNSCGATAQRTGKVVDNIAALEVALQDGTRFWCRPTDDVTYAAIEARGDRQAQIYRGLRRLRDAHGDLIRSRFPDIPRRVSGYNLDSLLEEHGFDVAGLLVGSEGTLVTVLAAELKLVPVVPERSLVMMGFDDIAAAADAVPAVLEHDPIALEGIDRYLLHDERIKHIHPDALAQVPEGDSFLLAQFGGDTSEEADERARHMLTSLGRDQNDDSVTLFDDPRHEHELWAVRESGLGATAHVPGHPDTFEGWEDSAVGPDRLGDYLRDLRRLFEEFGYAGDTGPSLYGHFGQGCVHTRIPFDLYNAAGVANYRRFVEHAARLVTAYGGSLSGEHGDGQSRGELLTIMFGPDVVALMEQVKDLFDPANLMNPGKVVRPRRLDQDLRLGATWAPSSMRPLAFAYPHDGGSFVDAANRCVGVGKCRSLGHDGGQVMCPSYQVTRAEEHSTRGRARLLFEMLDGHGDSPVSDGWRSTEVRDALDLCLACKGCKSDCPADVDMATYKAEFLFQHYRHRLRPRSDYAMGWLPVAAHLISRSRASRAANLVSHAPLLGRALTRAAGLEAREVPLFAHETLQQWFRRRGSRPGPRGSVVLWPDTFTNTFHPHVGQAAVRVLEDAGWEVQIPTEPMCCGLTWISTGQLNIAGGVLRRTASILANHLRTGGLVVGLEPSCTAVFRSDAADLLPDDHDVARLRAQTVTLAELLTHHSPGWTCPPLSTGPGQAIKVVSQVHCHQHAVLGAEADRQLLADAGADIEQLESGCCGLAGNFGFTAGHGDVSRACAEQVLLPRLRQEESCTVVLADGFSCRTQIHELAEEKSEARHLAELLSAALDRPDLDGTTLPLIRPKPPSSVARWAASGGFSIAGLLVGAIGLRGALTLIRQWARPHISPTHDHRHSRRNHHEHDRR